MLNRKNKLLLKKLLSLFSIVRGYNVLMITLAQYLASLFILSPSLSLREVLLDSHLFIIVTASALVIAAGYIINNFYDREKDLINKPTKSMLDRLVSQRFKLTTYFILNLLAVFFASYISFRAVLFFSVYIFVIWYYSHKLKRLLLIGNIISAMLAIAPFFVVFVYYKNFETVIFFHAVFLFFLILARELIKDLENMAGDLAQNYKTIPIVYGAKIAKISISFIVVLTLIPAWVLTYRFDIGYMYVYFGASIIGLLFFILLLVKAKKKKEYVWLHNILKVVIVSGVFSILLIDVNLILNSVL